MDKNYSNYYFDRSFTCMSKLFILILLIVIALFSSVMLWINIDYPVLTIAVMVIDIYHSMVMKFTVTDANIDNYIGKMCLPARISMILIISTVNGIMTSIMALFIVYLVQRMFY